MEAYHCLLCRKRIPDDCVAEHKLTHPDMLGYGIMWPPQEEVLPRASSVPTYESAFLADALGVGLVYVRDEGANPSGSMKDYSVERAIALGLESGRNGFSVISSGNHAFSLCFHVQGCGARAVVFAPASSSKISLLASFPNVLVVAMEGAIFEDVYNLVTSAQVDRLTGMYNANVNNERLLAGFSVIAGDILSLSPRPTHVLSGVGNGSYLAGIVLGLQWCGADGSFRIVPIGMRGAFPTEVACGTGIPCHKYQEFSVPEDTIDAAEGSIATESYSMPQLTHAVQLSGGFTLGDLTNEDLRAAYLLLARDADLVEKGVVPEPTGIMSLAAANKWRHRFTKDDALLLSFTGHGAKDLHGIQRLVPEVSDMLTRAACRRRPDLAGQAVAHTNENVIIITKTMSPDALGALILKHAGRE